MDVISIILDVVDHVFGFADWSARRKNRGGEGVFVCLHVDYGRDFLDPIPKMRIVNHSDKTAVASDLFACVGILGLKKLPLFVKFGGPDLPQRIPAGDEIDFELAKRGTIEDVFAGRFVRGGVSLHTGCRVVGKRLTRQEIAEFRSAISFHQKSHLP